MEDSKFLLRFTLYARGRDDTVDDDGQSIFKLTLSSSSISKVEAGTNRQEVFLERDDDGSVEH
jgi:hypothetical protein